MKQRPKPVVGQTLYSLDLMNNRRRTEANVLTPVEVSSVGRKYFGVKKAGFPFETKHHLDTWVEVSRYSPNAALYASEQEWADEKEADALVTMLYGCFSNYSARKLPLETLRQIRDLIQKEQTK